ncbi:MAG: hypothetical protein AABW73_04700 [Nanoarchaeota archaeon]
MDKDIEETNEDVSYPTKEDLEKAYNKEKGYYKYYSWFEDLICNVCGKIIRREEGFDIEQEFVEEELVTFCHECLKLPNKKELVKIPLRSGHPKA